MLSDQVLQPRRCSGNRAAVLPTLPQATQDCTESTVGMSGHIPIHAVEDILDVEEDDDAADAEETDPGGMHRTTLPGMREKQPEEPPHWLVYFAADDVGATLAKVNELGGGTIAGPFDMAGAKIAVARDPQGAVFALYAGPLES